MNREHECLSLPTSLWCYNLFFFVNLLSPIGLYFIVLPSNGSLSQWYVSTIWVPYLSLFLPWNPTYNHSSLGCFWNSVEDVFLLLHLHNGQGVRAEELFYYIIVFFANMQWAKCCSWHARRSLCHWVLHAWEIKWQTWTGKIAASASKFQMWWLLP